MKLYVLRHGHSPSVTEAGVFRDEDRPLSEKGRSEVGRVIAQLAAKGGAPAAIYTSPLRRAVETGGVAASVLKLRSGTEVFEPLSNMISGMDLFLRLREKPGVPGELLIVGHQPQVGDLVKSLTGISVEFRPGGLAALETDSEPRGKAVLLWSINP